MTRHYFDVAFTPKVLNAQKENGSQDVYGKLIPNSEQADPLTEAEAAFMMARDSFYMASVNEDGWPYIQHRGGPRGFIKILSPHQFAIADYRGNRQYVSLGNIRHDDRVSLFFMDYPNRRRLKMFARVRDISLESDPDLIATFTDADYKAKVERGLVFTVEAFEWNCPQHITPRFTVEEAQAYAAMGD